MKILVIGASSFTGAAFSSVAEAAGHEVLGLSRPDYDLNIDMPEALVRFVGMGFENVVNFAALNMVGESWEYAPDYYRTNVVGVARLAKALSGAPLRRFVQVSTPEVYGATQTFLEEGAPYNPSTPYAASRAAADTHLDLLHRQFAFPVCFTRTVNVYGVGQQLYRIIPKTALLAFREEKLPLHGGGVSSRSFIHVGDVARGILRVLEAGVSGQIYHMATSRQTQIRELVAMICRRCGVPFEAIVESAPERGGKDMAYQLDDSKIRGDLGWTDRVELEDGLDEVVAWVRGKLPELVFEEYEHRP